MWFKFLILGLVLAALILGGYWGWWWWQLRQATTYQELLETLYQRTEVPLLHPSELADLSEYLILDVRSAAEYAVSHLPHAQFVDYNAPDYAALDSLLQTQRPVLVYCSVGYRSAQLGQQLLERYSIPVYNLYGGLFGWANAQYPLLNAAGETTQTVHGFSPQWGRWVDNAEQVVYE